jgi:nucleoside-diphosphate-sugar epimerase
MLERFTSLNEIPDSWPGAPMRANIRRQRRFYTGKRGLVTGAFGFLGGHLCRALIAAGCFVTALDKCTDPARDSQLTLTGLRDHLEVVQADITDRQAMQELITHGKYDFIFHIAAGATVIEKALNSPYDTIMANTMGFVNLAEAARLLPEEERPVILYSSTDKVYGEAKQLPYTEDSDLGGVGVYDSAKLAADIFAGTYHKALGVPTVVLRMCNLFGPYDFNIDYRLIPKALRNIFRDGEAPELYLNALEHFRDYIYVEDAARAFMVLAEQNCCRGRVYNLPGVHHASTPDVLTTITETVAAMQDDEQNRHPDSQFANLKWSRSIRVVPSDPKLIVISKQHLDGTRIRDEAGFEPEVGFRDGLKNTIRFYSWLFCRETGRCKESTPSVNGNGVHAAEESPIRAEVVTLTPQERALLA